MPKPVVDLNLQPGDIQPGDLITSDLANWILKRLTLLESLITGGGGGPITVPNLFGRTINDVKVTLSQPQFQLVIGIVLDTFGAVVDPFSTDFLSRLVLGQSPPPGARVAATSALGLVVAAKPGTGGGGGGGTPVKPVINAFEPVKPNAGELVRITGSNFATLFSDNTVRFAGVPAAPSSGDTLSLQVRVPTTIPGLPPVGSTEEKAVDVIVITPQGGSSDSKILSVRAPLPQPAPSIASIKPPTPSVGASITITGSNFAATGSPNTVMFDSTAVNNVLTTAAGELVLTVPAGVVPPNDSRIVGVKVITNSRSSDVFNVRIVG
jgi:hypothetical protein